MAEHKVSRETLNVFCPEDSLPAMSCSEGDDYLAKRKAWLGSLLSLGKMALLCLGRAALLAEVNCLRYVTSERSCVLSELAAHTFCSACICSVPPVFILITPKVLFSMWRNMISKDQKRKLSLTICPGLSVL